MTYAEVKAHYFNEEMEIALAKPSQIAMLCIELETDQPQALYDHYKEELEYMMMECCA